MDFLKAQYPPKLIRDKFNLTDDQINVALSYTEANRIQVEAEYQEVLKTREEIRQYWGNRNHEYFSKLAEMPHNPGQATLWAKLEAQKSRHASETV